MTWILHVRKLFLSIHFFSTKLIRVTAVTCSGTNCLLNTQGLQELSIHQVGIRAVEREMTGRSVFTFSLLQQQISFRNLISTNSTLNTGFRRETVKKIMSKRDQQGASNLRSCPVSSHNHHRSMFILTLIWFCLCFFVSFCSFSFFYLGFLVIVLYYMSQWMSVDFSFNP